MSVLKIALLGFGTVGKGVYKSIQSHGERLEKVLGKKVEIVAILVRNKQKQRRISGNILVTDNFEEIINLPQIDYMIEAIVGKEPAFTYLKRAVEKGSNIITANKEMFAYHGEELSLLAADKGVSLGYEATVGGGIPIIQTLRQLLKVNNIKQIKGILNGTSNFILTEMREKREPFASVLKTAQEKGYAEADPGNDVEGTDAFYKLMVLSKLAFGIQPEWKDVHVEGITSITREWIEEADRLHLKFKHIASIEWKDGKVIASVQPVLVGKSSPFYDVEGVENAVNIEADLVGSLTLRGPGAGMFPTASAVIEDLAQSRHQTDREAGIPIRDSSAQDNQKEANYWLLDGVKKKVVDPSIEWLKQHPNNKWIIKSSVKGLNRILDQNPGTEAFPVLAGIVEKESSDLFTASL